MPKVLVIDEISSMIETVRTSVPDWTVLSASDGITGLDMLEQHHKTIDLILLELRMPRLDGRTVLLRMQTLYPRIPVRLWSASFTHIDSQLALELTGMPPVEKPISPSDLAAELYQTLGYQAAPH